MIYLIDSDALISAHRRYYRMEHFPSLWTWLDKQFDSKILASITDVQSELLKFKLEDPLKIWAQNNKNYFLSMSYSDDKRNLKKITNYVNVRYNPGQHITNFIGGADIKIIAKALTIKADGSDVTIVTNEQSAPNAEHKVKIPDVCKKFGIPTMTFFDCIYNLNINI